METNLTLKEALAACLNGKDVIHPDIGALGGRIIWCDDDNCFQLDVGNETRPIGDNYYFMPRSGWKYE